MRLSSDQILIYLGEIEQHRIPEDFTDIVHCEHCGFMPTYPGGLCLWHLTEGGAKLARTLDPDADFGPETRRFWREVEKRKKDGS